MRGLSAPVQLAVWKQEPDMNAVKTMNLTKYTFAVAGAVMLIIAVAAYTHTRSFLAQAARTEGTVIRLDPVRSSDGTTYKPIVRFEHQGRQIEFASSGSSNPPAFHEGERVSVAYLESDPYSAKIDTFFSLYGLAVILGGMGSVFFLVGAGIIFVQVRTRRTDEHLLNEGVPITTAFQSVMINDGLAVNGRHPFKVVTQWLDSATSQVRVFESHNVWFDPAQYIKQKEITVYLDRADPKKYYMDLSFLPRLAS
jgi:hypothetical protein